MVETNFETNGIQRNLPSINLLPVMLIGSALSISLSASAAWFVSLIVIAIVLFLAEPPSFGRALSRLLPIIAVFVILFAYSAIIRDEQSNTASSFNIASWALILLILAVEHQRHGKDYFAQGLKQLGVALFAVAIFGVLEGIAGYNPFVGFFSHILGEWRMGTISYRASSIFSHPIPFAHMMLIGMTIFMVAYKGSLAKKVFAVAVFLMAIIESQTRSALVIAIVIFCLLGLRYLISSRQGRLSAFAIIACCLFALVVMMMILTGYAPSFASGLIERLSTLDSFDVSVTQRTGAVQLLLDEVFRRSPLELFIGNGISSSNELIGGTTISIENFNTVDNNWMTVLFDFGVVAFMAMIVLALRGLYHFLFNKDSVIACYGAVVTISSLYMFFYSFTMWKCTIFVLLLGYYAICCLTQAQSQNRAVLRSEDISKESCQVGRSSAA